MRDLADKHAMMLAVMDVYDELEDVRYELAEAKARVRELEASQVVTAEAEGLGAVDADVLHYGREHLFKECTYSWGTIAATIGDDGQPVFDTSFDGFVSHKVYRVPDFMSKNEFLDYFEDELRAAYALAKSEAVRELKREAGDGVRA